MQETLEQCLISPTPDAVFCELAGETVILDMRSGQYFALDPIGTRIWQSLATPQTLSALCDSLVEEYDVEPEVCREDVSKLLIQMQENGLITVSPVEQA